MIMKTLGIVVVISLAFVACTRRDQPSANLAHTSSQMTALINEHRFDEAAKLGLRSVTGKPSDASIFYLVSLAYAERARYESDTRNSSLKLVDEYSQKSLSQDPGNQLNRFNIAWVLEYAGDVGSDYKCRYYHDSRQLLDASLSSSASDDVLKKEIEKKKTILVKKMSDAQCE